MNGSAVCFAAVLDVMDGDGLGSVVDMEKDAVIAHPKR